MERLNERHRQSRRGNRFSHRRRGRSNRSFGKRKPMRPLEAGTGAGHARRTSPASKRRRLLKVSSNQDQARQIAERIASRLAAQTPVPQSTSSSTSRSESG